MIGDCSRCGHSIAYHLPLFGCLKDCGCGEYKIVELIGLYPKP